MSSAQDRSTLDARRKTEGPHKVHVVTHGGERNEADGKDLEQHSSRGKGPADVAELLCCLTRHQGVMGMS